jgi:hypothetical protein
LCRSEGRQCSARRTAPRTRIAAAHPFDSALSSTEQPGQSAQRYTQSPQSSIPNISQAVKPRNRRVWKKAARSRHTLSAGTSPPGLNLRYGLRPTQDEPPLSPTLFSHTLALGVALGGPWISSELTWRHRCQPAQNNEHQSLGVGSSCSPRLGCGSDDHSYARRQQQVRSFEPRLDNLWQGRYSVP